MENDGGHFNGFLLGALVGGAAVFFLATPKGRKLLKSFVGEGIEGISELGDLFEEYEEEAEEEFDETPIVAAEKPHPVKKPEPAQLVKEKEAVKEIVTEPLHRVEEVVTSSAEKVVAAPRRFFRKVKRG